MTGIFMFSFILSQKQRTRLLCPPKWCSTSQGSGKNWQFSSKPTYLSSKTCKEAAKSKARVMGMGSKPGG